MSQAGLVILGFGGHARSVADIALRSGWDRLQFYDINARPDEYFNGFPATGQLPDRLPSGWSFFLGAVHAKTS